MLKKLRKMVADFDQVAAELHEWVNRPMSEPETECFCGQSDCMWAK
jgi:hypothetical protein